MPRPTKAFKRQRTNAAEEWKKGNKKEAYELWAKAAQGRKEHLGKKRNKAKAAGAEGAAPTTG